MHKRIWQTATDRKCIQLCLQTDNAEDIPEDLSTDMAHTDAYVSQKLCMTVKVCCTYSLNIRQAERRSMHSVNAYMKGRIFICHVQWGLC